MVISRAMGNRSLYGVVLATGRSSLSISLAPTLRAAGPGATAVVLMETDVDLSTTQRPHFGVLEIAAV